MCLTGLSAAGMGLASCDVTILRAVFDTLANHYPERMGQLWMYDAPLVFWGLWKVRTLSLIPRRCACAASASCAAYVSLCMGGAAPVCRLTHPACFVSVCHRL